MKAFYIIFLFYVFFTTERVRAQDVQYDTMMDILYYDSTMGKLDVYQQERCVLDLYYSINKSAYSTVIWFHGGGLSGGNKFIPESLKNKGLAVVGVNYRLHPKVNAPVYIEDAAAAVAWVIKNISRYNGDPSKIFVSGHSAGGYLASMIGLDKKYLAKYGIDSDHIAGLIPFSGHTITHFTIRAERGIAGTTPIIDEFAPLFHVRPDAPPLYLITGDRELELLGRYE